jgi:FkbM family methyltransferase
MLAFPGKAFLRRCVYRRLILGFNASGVPYCLAKHLPARVPITLVDIGAHEGCFTEALRAYTGIKQGLLVEPLPGKVLLLRRKFPDSTFAVEECVVGNSKESVKLMVNEYEVTSSILNIHRDSRDLSLLDVRPRSELICQQRTLDSLVADHNFQRVDLLKIDVQGVEHLVLAGGQKALLQVSLIWIEVSFRPLYESSSTFADIYATLQTAGFRLLEIEPGFRAPDGELLQADALFAR